MQRLTDLSAVDRELAGRVARFAAVTDTQFEPWHQPHFNVQHDSAPAPAEAATSVGADQDTLPKEPMTPAESIYLCALYGLSGFLVFSVGAVIGRAAGWW